MPYSITETLRDKGIQGVSDIAVDDGVECIAEVKVLLTRGDAVPLEALQLYKEYFK